MAGPPEHTGLRAGRLGLEALQGTPWADPGEDGNPAQKPLNILLQNLCCWFLSKSKIDTAKQF